MANRRPTKPQINKPNRNRRDRSDRGDKDNDSFKRSENGRNCDISTYGLRDGSSGKNDPSFWNKMTGIYRPATSIPINAQLGVNPLLSGFNSSEVESPLASIPGIMVMHFTPVVGQCTTSTDPLNALLTSSYAWYRSNYRAASRYEPADIGIYYVGISSAAMMWAEFTRIIGLVRLSKMRNLYYPQQLVRALGYDYENLAKNLSDLEELINTFASQLRRWPIPSELAVTKRWAQLSSNVYKDADSETAQTYVWQTNGFYTYNEGSETIAGKLEWNAFSTDTVPWSQNTVASQATLTIDNIAEIIQQMMTPFFGSSSMAQIASDTSSALGVGALFTIPDIAPNFTIEPKYELEEQAQIENALFIGAVSPSDITQTVPNPSANQASYLTQTVTPHVVFPIGSDLTARPLVLTHNKIVNFHNPHEISSDDIMVNTRFMPTGRIYSDSDGEHITLDAYGTEIATTFKVVVMCDTNRDGNPHGVQKVGLSSWVYDQSAPASETIATLYHSLVLSQLISAFDWHPIVYKYARGMVSAPYTDYFTGGNTDADAYCMVGVEGDIDQYAQISNTELKSLHTAAVMSAFFVDKVTYYTP